MRKHYAKVLLCLLLAGCASVGPPTEIPDLAEETAAQSLLAEGDFPGAAQEYMRLAKHDRRNRNHYLLKAADAWREEGDFPALEAALESIKRKRLSAAEAIRMDLLLAESALNRGDAATALQLAVVPTTDDANLRSRAGEIRARALDATHQPLLAAEERVHSLAWLSGSDQTALREDLLNGLAVLTPAELKRSLADLPYADARRPWLEKALRQKGTFPPRRSVAPMRQAGTLVPNDDANSASWRKEGFAPPSKISLLLPLSGQLATAGKTIRDGFLAAYFADSGLKPEVAVVDAGESADSALAAYRLAVKNGSTRVVGPLTREQIGAVLAQIDPRVPALALNYPEDGSVPPLGSQQFGLMPEEEGMLIAEYAQQRGLKKAAVFSVNEEWSERARLAFEAQWDQLHGAIAGKGLLAANTVDYAGAIAQAGLGKADFVVLFLRPNQGRLLVPQLRLNGATRMPILASSHIFAGSINSALDRDLEGVLFCDVPWLFGHAAGMPHRDSLARLRPAINGSPRLFAFGMDAYRLLPYLGWLQAHADGYLQGANGQLAVDPFGRVQRFLAWLRFANGVPQAAANALTSETVPP